MPRRLLLREGGSSKRAPSGFISISTKDGQLKTDDDKGASKPVSATGEKFTANGEVYEGELVYLNEDGTVSVPGNIKDDDNKADNIIGVFLSDANDGESVSVITKGIISLPSFDFTPRTIYYITSDGYLTTSVTPYIFGKSLSSNNIMIDISFMQTILNRYGVTPTFDRLVANATVGGDLEIFWSSKDKITQLEIPEYDFKIDKSKEPVSATASFSLTDLIEDNTLENGGYLLGKITNEEGKTAEFKFQLIGGGSNEISFTYAGLGKKYNTKEGIFNDFDYFSSVYVSFIFYSDGKWIFGNGNILPLRKIFATDGVKKDENGIYVNATIKSTEIKIYESGSWEKMTTESYNSFLLNVYSDYPFLGNELLQIYRGDIKSDPKAAVLLTDMWGTSIGSVDKTTTISVSNGKVGFTKSDTFTWQISVDGKAIYSGQLQDPKIVIKDYTYFDFGVLNIQNTESVEVEAEYNDVSYNYNSKSGIGVFIDEKQKDSDENLHIILYTDNTFELGPDNQNTTFISDQRDVYITGNKYSLYYDGSNYTWDYYVEPPVIDVNGDFDFNSSLPQLSQTPEIVTVTESPITGDNYNDFMISGSNLTTNDLVVVSVSDATKIEIRNMGTANNPTDWSDETSVSSDWLMQYTNLNGGLDFQVRMKPDWTLTETEVSDNGDGTYTYYGEVYVDSSEQSISMTVTVNITIKP
jgi:hypothetical protein